MKVERSSAAALQLKFRPPASAGAEMRRPQLVEAVQAHPQKKLVVIRAPAGFGKTTAMAQLRVDLERSGVRTVWLTLDAADNDPPRFLQAVQCCVDQLIDEDKRDWIPGADELPILSRLAVCEVPFALFLDEFESIHESRVIEWIRELISQLPTHGRVVVGSRIVPDLRLARLRALGQLVEVDAAQLRFSEAETKELLCANQRISLTPALLAELHFKTEGWVTGLQLASIALDRQDSKAEFIRRFSGSNMPVSDYLLSEVLEGQSEDIRQFLLRTSILSELTPALCDALVPNVDSALILRDLSAKNVLLSPVEGDAPTYRYHSLFAGFLQSQLRTQLPHLIPKLHTMAAVWFSAQGRDVRAVDHYLEGGDFKQALLILERQAQELLAQGRLRLLARWFSLLPQGALSSYPVLKMVQIWTVCLTRGPQDAMQALENSGLVISTDDQVWPYVMAIKPTILTMMDRPDEAYKVGRTVLARLPSGNSWIDGALINTMSSVFSQMGETTQSIELINASRRVQSEYNSPLHKMYTEIMEGTLDLFGGHIYEANARFRTALAVSRWRDHASAGGNTYAAMFYALTLYERNQIGQASELLRTHLPLVRDIGLPDHMINGYRMLARIAFQAGEVDEAFRLLTELELLGRDRNLPRVISSARLERSRIQISQGQYQAAQQELQRALEEGTLTRTRNQYLTANEVDYEVFGQLRWQATAGDPAAAAARLGTEAAAALSARRKRRTMALRLVQVIALYRSGQDFASRNLLEEVLKECHANGVVRMVLDEGPTLGVLVRQLHDRAVSGTNVLPDAKFVGYLAELIEGYGPDLPNPEPGGGGKAILLDKLTEKEVHVLHLLSEGYSNVAMAEKLRISDSTIRTHLRSINSKLAVSSRMQAVVSARRLGILR